MSGRSVNVYSLNGEAAKTAALPEVFSVAIRPDHVRYIHTQVAKNARQAYAVSPNSGYQHSAESWGTGRALARIPRIAGGGTHAAGQAAFGNMCRGGGMFAPTKTYRRWHRKVNVREKRHAVASALAASGVAAIVMARGHKVDGVAEIPCVVSDEMQTLVKTKEAVELLKKLGAAAELERSSEKHIRAGRGKSRNRKYKTKRGPLVVHACEDVDEMKGFRNIPGVELAHVESLNLLKLAPGGTLGRFVVFSESAFNKLSELYAAKSKYTLPRSIMTAADVSSIINSEDVQLMLKPRKTGTKPKAPKLNPLRNAKQAEKLAIKQL